MLKRHTPRRGPAKAILKDGYESPAPPFRVAPDMLVNPIRKPQVGQITVGTNLLTTTLAVITTVLVARDPLLTQRPQQRANAQENDQQVNLLETTLAPSGQAPFQQEDLTNPVRSRVTPQDTNYRNLTGSLLPPFKQTDWPNPKRLSAQIQDTAYRNLTTTTFYVSDVNIARDPLFTRKPDAKVPQHFTAPYFNPTTPSDPVKPVVWPERPKTQLPKQPEIPPSLLGTTLAPIGAKPFFQADWPNPVRGRFVTQNTGTLNQNTTLFFVPDVNLARDPLFTARPSVKPAIQVEYPNLLTNTLASADTVYFLNDTGLSADIRKHAQRIDIQNTLPLLTFVAPTLPPDSQDLTIRLNGRRITQETGWGNPLPLRPPEDQIYFLNDSGACSWKRFVQQPDQQNGVIQALTFVAPQIPYNNYHWPNPQPLKPVPERWNTSQGQNPDMIVPTITAPDPTQKPAGRKRRKYEVEIDGQIFEVSSATEAMELLGRAKELAKSRAPILASAVVEEKLKDKPPVGKPIRVPVPQISTPDQELVNIVIKARHDIARMYREAAMVAEIRLRMEQAEREQDDDDETVLFLL